MSALLNIKPALSNQTQHASELEQSIKLYQQREEALLQQTLSYQ
jgi:hypothetical protein